MDLDVEQAYNIWAKQYDTNLNKIRDLEAIALRENIGQFGINNCLEIGCGTGKNTEWLLTKIQTAKKYGFEIRDINEYFDDGDKNSTPRILTILLKKSVNSD